MLKDSVQIKNMKLASRLVMPPKATEKSGEDGEVTQD